MVDLTNKVPREGTCSECFEYKKIIACQDEELFCEDCFNKDSQKTNSENPNN